MKISVIPGNKRVVCEGDVFIQSLGIPFSLTNEISLLCISSKVLYQFFHLHDKYQWHSLDAEFHDLHL